MQFELDPDETQLRDSVRRMLAGTVTGLDPRRRGEDGAAWRGLAELGVAGLTLPEAHGGFAQKPIAWLPVLQELGSSLALQPFLPSVVLAGTAITAGGAQEQQDRWLPGIADGSVIASFAHEEARSRFDLDRVDCTAREAQGGWELHGAKHNVLHGMDAQVFVVSARTKAGVAMFLVEASQVERTSATLIDDTPVACVQMRGSKAQRLPHASVTRVIEPGIAAACAEGLGVAERAYELTSEYVRTRQQFGRAIGSNQAVRHRVAEMRVALEQLRSAAMFGLLALETEDDDERAQEVSRARMLASRHGTFITQQAIQLHGGIGMTTEYAVGRCLRRMTVLEMMFGDGATHAARLGARIVGSADGRDRLAA